MSCLDDGRMAIRGGRIMLIPRKAGPVVSLNVAHDALIVMKRERGKPASVAKVSVVIQV